MSTLETRDPGSGPGGGGFKKRAAAKVNEEDYRVVFGKFCSSSTIHGTYFWGEATSWFGRLMWILIVILGISSSAMVINNSFKAWANNPVITSVAQIPIEKVPFPSVTICPLGNTRFGYVEHMANEHGLDEASVWAALLESLLLIRSLRIESSSPASASSASCLVAFCEASASASSADNITEANCPHVKEFETYVNELGGSGAAAAAAAAAAEPGQQGRHKNYSDHLISQLLTRLPAAAAASRDQIRSYVSSPSSPPTPPTSATGCRQLAKDFEFLALVETTLANLEMTSTPPGALLKWLYTNIAEAGRRSEMFGRYFRPEDFPGVYSSSLGTDDAIPLPELVDLLTKTKAEAGAAAEGHTLAGLRFSEPLMRLMRLSAHPPHVAESLPGSARAGPQAVPHGAFPFCWYQDRLDDGVRYGPYGETYCRDFQTTVNEVGLCYTYNNYDLGTDPDVAEGDAAVQVREVKGCGKRRGLRVIVDSHKLATKAARDAGFKGDSFRVFVTVPGVVTHKVPFTVDSSFHGEHSFYFHGIHYIDTSAEFRDWNAENHVCYFPGDKNLTFFSGYTQDNCLLECRYLRVAELCGCLPWYLKQAERPICSHAGNACFQREFDAYQQDQQDRVDCDCRGDCGGIHIFSSMNRFPFTDTSSTDASLYWDPSTRSGRLANYLLDPEHAFVDALSKNLTRMAHGLEDDVQLATKRFTEDISVLNFFFDTPIITRITLEMRITVFDQISAVGGTLGLFTGVSIITFAECFYWGVRFLLATLKRGVTGDLDDDKEGEFERNAGSLNPPSIRQVKPLADPFVPSSNDYLAQTGYRVRS